MARTMIPWERQAIASPRVGHYTRLEVKDSLGTWRDVSAILAADYLMGASVRHHRDQPIAGTTFRIRRRNGSTSLAPFLQASGANTQQNLALQSGDFTSATWAAYYGKPTVTAGKQAPDGTLTAHEFATNDTGPSGQSGVLQTGAATVMPGAGVGTFTVRVWARCTAGVLNMTFGLDDSNMVTVQLTTTWQQFTATFTRAVVSTNRVCQFFESSASNVAWQLWRPQVNAGALALDYVPTVAAVVNNYAPLLDLGREIRWSTAVTHDGLAPATNLLRWSQDLTNALWTKTAGGTATAPVVTGDFATAPDGSTTADRVQLAMNGGTTLADITTLAQGITCINGGYVFVSIWLRTNDGSTKQVAIGAASGIESIITVTPAWQRFTSRTWLATGTGANFLLRLRGTYGTSDSADLLVWGCQAEQSAVAVGVAGDYVKTDATGLLTSWREAFYGRIDRIGWESDPVAIDCSSLDAWLQDTQIEVDALQYGTKPVGTALEVVVQNIINASHSGKLSGAQETLYTPTSPAFFVTDYVQGRVKVLEAIRNVVLNSTGWDVRFRYDASHVSRLTLLDPQRARVTVDDVIGPSEYGEVTQLELALADIRNVGKLWYRDTNGALQSVTSSNAASITAYGRRYFELTAPSTITTAVQAQALLDAVVNDLAFPALSHALSMLYHWGVQLYDRHTLTQNGEHYDQDQTLAVIGVSHEFADGSGQGVTTIEYSGKVVGAYDSWLKQLGAISSSQFVIPTMLPSVSESGTTGTLKLQLVDPQARTKAVEYAVVAAAAALPDTSVAQGTGGWLAAPAPVGALYTLPAVTLVEKQDQKVAWRLWADIGAGLQVVASDFERFAVGARPAPPEVTYIIGSNGSLVVTVRGDSDTTGSRVVVSFDSPPSDAAIDAATLIVGRTAVYTLPTPLTNGQRFYVGARSYNTTLTGGIAAQSSTTTAQTDQWAGPSSGQASVSVGSIGVTDKLVTLNGIVLGAQTTDVLVYVREYRTDPGVAVDVQLIGYKAIGTPLHANGSLSIPVSNPSNYIIATLVAVDSLNRVGNGAVTGTGAVGGTVTVKAQAAAAPPAAQNPPTALALTQVGSNGVQLAITMPATSLPDKLRIYRNGAAIADVVRTAGASAVQNYNDTGLTPGSSYTYAVYGLSNAGVLTTTSSPSQTITITAATIPTPTLAMGAYDLRSGGFPMTVTPGAGSPAGVTWYLEHSADNVSWAPAENTSATSFLHAHTNPGGGVLDYTRVKGSLSGYTDSLYSAVQSQGFP